MCLLARSSSQSIVPMMQEGGKNEFLIALTGGWLNEYETVYLPWCSLSQGNRVGWTGTGYRRWNNDLARDPNTWLYGVTLGCYDLWKSYRRVILASVATPFRAIVWQPTVLGGQHPPEEGDGLSLGFSPNLCERMFPTPVSKASTSTGWIRVLENMGQGECRLELGKGILSRRVPNEHFGLPWSSNRKG